MCKTRSAVARQVRAARVLQRLLAALDEVIDATRAASETPLGDFAPFFDKSSDVQDLTGDPLVAARFTADVARCMIENSVYTHRIAEILEDPREVA